MDTVCRKYSCMYNENAKCSRSHLQVSKNADCFDIKIDKQKQVEDVSRDMFCHEPEIAPYHHCRRMDIACDSKECIFWEDGQCFSNGIFIGSEKKDAPCNSFVPR